MAGERPMRGSCSSASPGSSAAAGPAACTASARSTALTSSRKSKGLGRYSKAPRSLALTAVSSVFCALMTMTRSSGRSFLMRGTRSRPFSSGMMTSVMTRSPSPSETQRHSVAALPVVLTSWPRRPSAWLSTVRMARSSSAMRMVDALLMLRPPSERFAWRQRQADAEHRAPRLALEFDDAAMVADHFGDERQAEAAAVALGADEGIEEMLCQLFGDAFAVVDDLDDQRQVDAAVAAGDGQTHAVAVGGGDLDLAALRRHGLGGVLDEIQEQLNQQVAVAVHRRQRGIVILDEAHMAGEARLRDEAHAVQHFVDVGAAALDRPLVGEHLHAVDEGADAIALVADEPRQLAVAGAGILLQELRRAADAGERVLHLMRQHRRHRRHRARSVAMHELAVDLVGDRALLQRDDDVVAVLGDGRRLHRHDMGAEARRLDGDAVFGDAVAALAHAGDERKDRAVGRQQLGKRRA